MWTKKKTQVTLNAELSGGGGFLGFPLYKVILKFIFRSANFEVGFRDISFPKNVVEVQLVHKNGSLCVQCTLFQ